jgi:hypothetical protein
MLNAKHIETLVNVGSALEIDPPDSVPPQLQNALSRPVPSRQNVTEVVNTLAGDDAVSFFKALVYFEKLGRLEGGSIFPTIWAFSRQLYDNSQPPSMSIVVPVTKSFSIMKMIPCATSSAVPARGMIFLAVAFE